MLGSLSAEVLKVVKRPATWIIVAVWLILNQCFAYLFPYISYTTGGTDAGGPPVQSLDALLPAQLVGNNIGGYPMFGGALMLLLGVLATGNEYQYGTMKMVLTQRPSRLQVFGGQLSGLVLMTLVVTLASFAISTVWSLVIAGVESQPVTWPAFGDLIEGVGGAWLIFSMWAVGGAMLGILVRGTALAVGLGLVWALVVENLINGVSSLLDIFASIYKVLPGANAGSLASALGGTGAPGLNDVVSGTRGVLTVAAFAVAFVLIGGAVLHRRDVT